MSETSGDDIARDRRDAAAQPDFPLRDTKQKARANARAVKIASSAMPMRAKRP
jgi:hypothetical protein